MSAIRLSILAALLMSLAARAGAEPATRPDASRGDRMIAEYFRDQTRAISGLCLSDVKTLRDWETRHDEYRRQLADMLGLWPRPQKTDLKATVTGTVDHPEFTVEKLHFQSRPGLYVTANLYVPKGLTKPAPAILYVCGHSPVKKNGVSYGNKVAYQHHGAWFARNGYVCLVPDTLELGEIEGIHHGTYSQKMWWWQSRGYTPAGVEAWNGIRAIDYLVARPEVDATRIGMTGRSGGGAYTWWVAALDDRVKVAAPVAGITDLQNHVVDGCIEGHCDCMYMVNTYRWDFAQVAALVAPRPLLIGNSDKDTIFPLDGVYRLHEQVRRIYQLYGQEKNLGLLITEGPHKDTQDLQVPVFRWFNRFLKQEDGPVDKVAEAFFEPSQLKVFDRLPADQTNAKIQETFVAQAPEPRVPDSSEEWKKQRDAWMAELRQETFGGWPQSAPPLTVHHVLSVSEDDVHFAAYDFTSQHDVRLRLFVARIGDDPPRQAVLTVLDEERWPNWLAQMRGGFPDALNDEAPAAPDAEAFQKFRKELQSDSIALAWVCPRGIGPTAWTKDEKKRTHIRRRFALLGQTLDGMRVWDVRRAVQALRSLDDPRLVPLRLRADGRMAGVAVYAALFEPDLAGLELRNPPRSHRDGPDLLNVLKVLDMPAAIAMAAERCQVRLTRSNDEDWKYPMQVARRLGWSQGRFSVRPIDDESR